MPLAAGFPILPRRGSGQCLVQLGHQPPVGFPGGGEFLTALFGAAARRSGEPGRVTGFLGPNGAGKTTTLRMILGLDTPNAGQALVVGRPYQDLRWPVRLAGALLNAGAVQPGRRARDHLAWLAASNRLPARRVGEVLGLTGLSGVAAGRVGSFSLGMRQRLGIAAALLGDPGVLLLDEPVNGLDPEGVLWVRTLMRALAAEGRTVLLSSHLMSEMVMTADHLIIIGRGRLLAGTGAGEFVRAVGPGASLEDAHLRLTASPVEYRASLEMAQALDRRQT